MAIISLSLYVYGGEEKLDFYCFMISNDTFHIKSNNIAIFSIYQLGKLVFKEFDFDMNQLSSDLRTLFRAKGKSEVNNHKHKNEICLEVHCFSGSKNSLQIQSFLEIRAHSTV